MRRLSTVGAVLCALALAACGGGKSSTSTTAASASASSTTSAARHGITTVARAQTRRGGRARSTERHPPSAVPAVACRNLPQPATGGAGALRLRDGLQPAIDSLSAFVAERVVALPERLRAGSVLRALRGAQSAAARYVASPTSANQKGLVAATVLEASTAKTEQLPQCVIPGA